MATEFENFASPKRAREADDSDGGQYDDASGFDLERYWSRALELKYWLLGLLAFALVAVVVFTLLATPKYQASSRIEINRVDIGSADLESTEVIVEERDRQYYETQYELLQSRFMAERVRARARLAGRRSVSSGQ